MTGTANAPRHLRDEGLAPMSEDQRVKYLVVGVCLLVGAFAVLLALLIEVL